VQTGVKSDEWTAMVVSGGHDTQCRQVTWEKCATAPYVSNQHQHHTLSSCIQEKN